MVGRAIALDLARDHNVTAFDLSKENMDELNSRNAAVTTVAADLSAYSEYPNWLSPFDIIVTAVPGFMGY